MRSVLDRVSWPARRWIADRLIGDKRPYSRNVTHYEFLEPRNLDMSSYGSNDAAYHFRYGYEAVNRYPSETA